MKRTNANNRNYVMTTVYVEPAVLAALTQLAKDMSMNRSEIMRKAFRGVLKINNRLPQPQ
jgi:hypothetical protein